MQLIKWDTWKDERELRELVKELYERKGYRVQDVHGRLEPGFDLLAERRDYANRRIIEDLGIQVTLEKADKSRLENASLALTKKDLRLSYFVIVAIKGQTEDFKVHLSQSKLRSRIKFLDAEDLEKELLRHQVFPDRELERIEEEFYHSETYSLMEEITNIIYEIGYRSEIDYEKAVAEVRSGKSLMLENLRLLVRSLQAISTIADRTAITMTKALSDSHLGSFLKRFTDGQMSVLQHFRKANAAINDLKKTPSVMKLIFGAFSATEKAFIRMHSKESAKELWLFMYMDPEDITRYGYRVILLHIFYGLRDRANDIKNRIENVIRLLEDQAATQKELKRWISFRLNDSV